MNICDNIQLQIGKNISLEEIEPNIYRVYAPFFHEDGDMYSIYIENYADGKHVCLRDFGNTLRRVSYTFDINSESKQNLLNNIAISNLGSIVDKEVIIETDIDRLTESLFQYSQLVSKLSNIKILKKEVIKSLFYEQLEEFIDSNLSSLYNIKKNYNPTTEQELLVDYFIDTKDKPLFIYGVKDNNKASKVIIGCLKYQTSGIRYRSVIVHNDLYSLQRFYQSQIINIADKQFVTLKDFFEQGSEYLKREA